MSGFSRTVTVRLKADMMYVYEIAFEHLPKSMSMRVKHVFGAVAIFVAVTALHAQPTRPNLLLITLDTVRADRLGAYGLSRAATPALDCLAREGVRFADATTPSPLTGPAHTAILRDRALRGIQARYGVRDNATTPIPEQAVTLAEASRLPDTARGGFIGAFVLWLR